MKSCLICRSRVTELRELQISIYLNLTCFSKQDYCAFSLEVSLSSLLFVLLLYRKKMCNYLLFLQKDRQLLVGSHLPITLLPYVQPQKFCSIYLDFSIPIHTKKSFNYHFSYSFSRTVIMFILVTWKGVWLLHSFLQKSSIPRHIHQQKYVLGLSKTWGLVFSMRKQTKIQLHHV